MNKAEITIYRPDERLRTGFLRSIWIMITNMINSKELIWQLFKRDFLMTYKKSFLGITWILISPIVGIVSWVFLNQAGVLDPGDVGMPFPAYVLISSSIWGLFMGFISSAGGTLGAGSGFIMQVNFPHEALLVKQLAQHLANFTLTFLLSLIVLVLFGVNPSGYLLLFPILIIPMLFLGSAIGLFMSVLSVVASDITNFINIGLSFVFYATPIVYSAATVKSELLRKVVQYNPLTYLVGGVRDLILFGKMDRPDIFLILSLISCLLFLISLRLFYLSESKVIEKMI